MFEEYDRVKHIVIICEKNKIVYMNKTALNYFGLYIFKSEVIGASSVISEENYIKIKEGLESEDPFFVSLPLSANKESRFIAERKSRGRKKYIVITSLPAEGENEPQFTENNLSYISPNPQKIGIEGLYDHEIATQKNQLLKDIEYMKKAVIIRRNNELFDKLSSIESEVKEILSKSKEYISTVASDTGDYIITRKKFNLCYTLARIVTAINSSLLMGGYNINIKYTEKAHNIFIFADYMRISKAITILISNSVRYVLASGKKARITISIDLNKRGNAVIMIKDNGKGVTPSTFAMLNGSSALYSVIPQTAREETSVDLGTVASWVELNGGKMKIKNSTDKGSLAELIFTPIPESSPVVKETEWDNALYNMIDEVFKAITGIEK